jgi:hypothetical protein
MAHRLTQQIGYWSCLILATVATSCAFPALESASESRQVSQEVIERVAKATVVVQTPTGAGTGFFVTTNGFLLTNYHVIAGADRAIIRMRDGSTHPVKAVCEYSPKFDLAILELDLRTPHALPLALPGSFDLGNSVFTIGHPHGHSWTLTKGYIAGKREEQGRPMIQISADISPGNSGGAIVLLDGSVCGIATYLERRTITFADGNCILDPSSVLKFGVGVDAFRKVVQNPGQRKFTMTQVASIEKKAQLVCVLSGLLDVTHERIVALREGIIGLKCDRRYRYDKSYRALGGKHPVTGSKAVIYNADEFVDAAVTLRAVKILLAEQLKPEISERSLDDAVQSWKKAIDAAMSAVQHVLNADGQPVSVASTCAASARRSFNSSVSAMASALTSTKTTLDKYDVYIVDHITPPSRIEELRKLYKDRSMKL